MIQRYSISGLAEHQLHKREKGQFVYHQDHIEELSQYLKRLAEKNAEIDSLRNALEGLVSNPESKAAYDIAEEALKEKP